MTEQALIETRAIEIAKDLQKLNTDDLERRGLDTMDVSRRRTLHNLEKSRDTKHSVVNLDTNFKRRLTILQGGDPSKCHYFISEIQILRSFQGIYNWDFLNIYDCTIKIITLK